VNKNLALLAVLFNLVEFPIEAVSKLCLFAPLFLSGNADYLKAFEPHQLHALVKSLSSCMTTALALTSYFWLCMSGVWVFALQVGLFPRTLGVLIAIAGLSYLTNSFTLILAPAFAATIFLVLGLP